jgi:hypothetical protein
VWITYGHPFDVAPGEDGFAAALGRATASLDEVSRNGAWRDEVIAIG